EGYRGEELGATDAVEGRVLSQSTLGAYPVIAEGELGGGVLIGGEHGGEKIEDIHLQTGGIRLGEDGTHSPLGGFPVQPDHGDVIGDDLPAHLRVESLGVLPSTVAGEVGQVEEERGAVVAKQHRHGNAPCGQCRFQVLDAAGDL